VLVRRVIRLLLDGNPPARILCLTFTKAAAANMANKVLEKLGHWVRLDDRALDRAIAEVSPLESTPELRARARRLFAAALETPGGLKVQTIHAFCDRVLHQFPFEAKVPAGFEVLDEIREADLLARARNEVLIEAAADPQGALGRALGHAVSVATDQGLDEALQEAVRARQEISRLTDGSGEAAVAAALNVPPGETTAAIEARILAGQEMPPSEWDAVAAALRMGSKIDQDLADRLAAAIAASPEERLAAYLRVFLTQDGKLRSRARFFTKAFGDVHPDCADRLDREFGRISELFDLYLSVEAYERTRALLTLAVATLRRYEEAKRAHSALDYADLIEKTSSMFEKTAGSWVLYRLDGGIDHVLIDEAQDTSPAQWSVIGKLTEEFFAGRGAREDRKRTIFAVGDEKQSIFSFQGADPASFDEMCRHFARRAGGGNGRFPVLLNLSFRSAPGVLKAIDQVFARPEAFKGLSSGGEKNTIHEAVRREAPALVEIWPVAKPDEGGVDGLAWDAPLNAQSARSAPVLLAQRIANAVKFWTGGGLAVHDRKSRKPRAARAGDVIVLVRRRGVLFDAILQALKRADVPVAGADRLELAEHIAVMDLVALGDALLLEMDDLALACALKSPLFGLSEQDLFDLAYERKGTLAAALVKRTKDNSRFAEAQEKLARWREDARRLPPFDFYSRVLGSDRGRERMIARLGIEAADALDEFLARALAYEQTETPSLAGFLAFLRRAGTQVKRDLEIESEAVRVMTVHGAKGLEAPIVVLADTTSPPGGRHDPALLALPAPNASPGSPRVFAWALGKATDSSALKSARENELDLRLAEYRRLLYVALTRAADALIVCGADGRGRDHTELPEACWYRLVRDALEGANGKPELVETAVPYSDDRVWRWRPETLGKAKATAGKVKPAIPRPAWFDHTVSPEPPPKRIRPSDLDPNDDAQPPYGQGAKASLNPRRRGELMHRLLQHLPELPPERRKEAAERYLAAAELPVNDRAGLAAEALALLDHPDMAALLDAQSGAEVSILARLPDLEGLEVSGRIDRLVVSPESVLIADYKTDAVPPATFEAAPPQYVNQLALYRAVIRRIYPDRPVRAFLVWTVTAAIHEIPEARLDAAIRQVKPA
jgi:ATP-dependent helicase/nuclease subunit A